MREGMFCEIKSKKREKRRKANAIYPAESGICLCFDVVRPNLIDLKSNQAGYVKACSI